jgi:hypothetical protein
MGEVVVAEDLAHRARVADAGDHRGMVIGVGIELAARQHGAQGLQRRLVGDVARGEDQRRFLVVQLASSRSSATCRVLVPEMLRVPPRPTLGADRRLHGLDHHRMLAHGEIVVGAPHGDVAHRAVLVEAGAREGAGDALQLGEDAIAPSSCRRFR